MRKKNRSEDLKTLTKMCILVNQLVFNKMIFRVECCRVCISSQYLLFVFISWPSQYFILIELLRHLFYWFNKWQNHLTSFVFHYNELLTKTQMRIENIVLVRTWTLKSLHIIIYSMFFKNKIRSEIQMQHMTFEYLFVLSKIIYEEACITSHNIERKNIFLI